MADHGLTRADDVPQVTGEMIRAQEWDQIIGQERMKEQLDAEIEAAVKLERNLDHFLLCGPPGYGKTTFASAIADRLHDPFYVMDRPNEQELLWAVSTWDDGGVLFIDELQDATVPFQALLRGCLETGVLTPNRGATINVRHITFGAGTTNLEKIIEPLRDRFILQPHFEDYTPDEMRQIVLGMAGRCGVDIPEDVAAGLASASLGTPRLVGRLIVAARTLATVGRELTAESVLRQVGVDADGLTGRHHEYLRQLRGLGGTAGAAAIRRMMPVSPKVVDELERDLLRGGFIRPSGAGRTMTQQGSDKIRKPSPSTGERRARA